MRRTHDIAPFLSVFVVVVFYPPPPSDPHGFGCYCCCCTTTMILCTVVYALSTLLREIKSQNYYARDSPPFGLCAAWCNRFILHGLVRNSFSVGMHVSCPTLFLFAFCIFLSVVPHRHFAVYIVTLAKFASWRTSVQGAHYIKKCFFFFMWVWSHQPS